MPQLFGSRVKAIKERREKYWRMREGSCGCWKSWESAQNCLHRLAARGLPGTNLES